MWALAQQIVLVNASSLNAELDRKRRPAYAIAKFEVISRRYLLDAKSV